MNSDALLLDTHVWLWLFLGIDKISQANLKLIEKAASNNLIFISAISTWEVSMLAAKKRITLTKPVLDWIQMSLAAPGMNLLPISPEIAVDSAMLEEFRGDPADRILVASARVENMTIITKDKKILAYAKNGYVQSVNV